MQGNEAEMCDRRLKGKFVSKNDINLSERNLTVIEISFFSKGLNFIPTCNKEDVSRLKLGLEQLGKMLHLKFHSKNHKRNISINQFRTKSTFNPTEIHLNS